MKFMKMFGLAAALVMSIGASACTRVGNGEAGVVYHTCGSNRGVEPDAVGMGWYNTMFCQNVEVFSTFTHTETWNAEEGGQFSFSDKDGQGLKADIAITFNVEGAKTPILFQKYRRGLDDIVDSVVHNYVRDALNTEASKHPIEWLYGEGRSQILNTVQIVVSKEIGKYGINVEKLAWVGAPEVPQTVMEAINRKTVAKQNAQRVENEVAQTRAEAEKAIAKAEGEAKAITIKASAGKC